MVTALIMGNEESYNSLDGMEYVYKRANSRTRRKASNLIKVQKRRKAKKALRRKRRGNK